jgi:carbonic anhydrase/acetyltransferase-like protein (isoleucine patch superfamily)
MASSRTQPATDADRFVTALNTLDHLPSWNEAASLGVPIVDLSREELALPAALAAPTVADLDEVQAGPGSFFLASGAVVQRDDLTGAAYQSGWWYDQRSTRVTTPHGERVHRPGIHPDDSIDPTAHLDPTARVEAGATIGPRCRIGAHVHIARDAAIAADSVIGDGSWIGTNASLGAHTWVSHGVTIEPHCVLGHHTTVGAGSRVTQGCQVEPYSRLGAATTTARTPAANSHRGVQIANAVDNLMRLDRE